MCFDGDPPQALSKVMRKARKVHRCDECGLTIQPGMTYEYTSGIWAREPGDYKTCEACQILREHVMEEDGCNEYPPFGMLIEIAREMVTDEHPHLIEEGYYEPNPAPPDPASPGAPGGAE